MNRGQLVQMVAGYLHRTDMQSQIETAIVIAGTRIGRDLRDSSNLAIGSVDLSVSNSLPADFSSVRDVFVGARPLLPATPFQTANANAAVGQGGGTPTHYSITGNTISLFPVSTPVITLSYWQRPADLVLDTDTNPVLDKWVQLYVYGALMESFFWTQDGDLTSYAAQSYQAEIEKINAAFLCASVGTSPAMRRV